MRELGYDIQPQVKEGRKHAEPAIEARQGQLEHALNDAGPVAVADGGDAVLHCGRDVLLHNEQHGPNGHKQLQHPPAGKMSNVSLASGQIPVFQTSQTLHELSNGFIHRPWVS